MPEQATEFLPWTSDAAVTPLLASCAANPPLGRFHRVVYALTADEWFAFSGARVDKLEAIRNAYGQRALDHADTTGDDAPMIAWCQSPTVGEVVREALDAPKLARAA